ncbi:class I adenylate cyclase [Otariodibacter oris]|uniref:Adenylate cyclase n=1 Tax=Otariodibacter oris TaxID=1032623 RepID=A0A420XEP5_9PAST|nr:class I adenylate cyclase [Otariodibacter oris]QGM81392.1 adenylate cyclase [Otariodibacter oris]RKR70793.1 adenylate cyclase class 1 [Otariodibacter oris]
MRELVFTQFETKGSGVSHLADSIHNAKIRIDQLDKLRIQRVLNNNTKEFHQVFSLIPLFIHYNHPDLIGYVEGSPAGLYHFERNNIQDNYFSAHISETINENQDYQFDALYVMGSLGSITQTTLSDIDIWLCHSKAFTENELALLHQKLAKIVQWAKNLGIDINFYLMNPDKFRTEKYYGDISSENSGSAQHYFLLDEFYRSAIRLAGKRILWLHIWEKHLSYQETVEQAINENIIDLEEWLDFGDFSSLELGEYFGASLWQLYKGIDHPYKSAIKILLLESYTAIYPKVALISKKFKRLLSKEKVRYHFDPYLAMLEQVTKYLEGRNEITRLECLRQCFYMKANEGQIDGWKKEELKKLALSWGWKEKDFAELDNKDNWKIKQAVRYQKMLVEQLLKSYRHLINFARKFHIDPSIMPQDTDLLMRKLYSVFEVLPGKVTLINEKIAKNLEEKEVTFVEVSENGPTKQGWYLINHAPLSHYDSTTRYVEYQKNLIQLVAWAYFNGVITVNTQLNIVSQTVSLARLRNFISDLRLSFPAKPPVMNRNDFYHPNEIRNLIVSVNLTNDPTRKMATQSDLTQIDWFNLNSSSQGLVGSVSFIYRNMWNEIITQHIEGNDAILKALKLISNNIYRSSAPPQSVNVFCYSVQLCEPLQKFVMGLVERCIIVQTGKISQKQHTNTFKLAGKKWQLVFGRHVELKECPSDSEHLKAPSEIYNFASAGFLQFFFEDNDNGSFNVFILDKDNNVEIYPECLGQKEDKIKQIIRLHDQDKLDRLEENESFNYPQFYQLLKYNGIISIVPFQSKQHRDYLETMSYC